MVGYSIVHTTSRSQLLNYVDNFSLCCYLQGILVIQNRELFSMTDIISKNKVDNLEIKKIHV